ncbi:uncharacterized protein LOC110825487 isoform X1 [Carica papaya]|uniref:uncharacterized protein LOC110825487 isoform X1 n=1 Tax=Carica papaya TaxID=3649 RepID=UPI000B8CDF45|nr:uncharacterized protein LOC110825487 isoform X1 [Carica papaya]XP_021911659.1 uncharacterized protein LOC110825487 isoform X1 [Carica papaya]
MLPLQLQHQFCLPKLSHRHRFLGNNQHHPQSYTLFSKARHAPAYPSLVPSSSSSSFISGSPEQLLDAKSRENQKRIAGVDQDELLDPQLLADLDSCFCEFQGVHIHHKVCDPQSEPYISFQTQTTISSSQLPPETKKVGFPMILLHGFGASVFSWNRVLKPLAELTGAKVLAFDRPAFGLTSRLIHSFNHSSINDTIPLNPYSMAFAVLATLHFIDFLAADKAILVGHSAGSLVAVNTYFEAPERVAALILVAPAILAPPLMPKFVERNNKTERAKPDSSNMGKQFYQLRKTLLRFSMYIVQSIMQIVKGIADMLKSLYKKALLAILHSTLAVKLVRLLIDKFGIAAVRSAWYDSKQVTDHVLHGYTKPLRAKGWDSALVQFVAAMLTDTRPPLAKRLHKISCPVLIITGDTDRIVPSWNAERLSRTIPGSTLEIIKNCGHLPHEEAVEEFVSVVKKFLQRVFDGQMEHS